MRKNISWRSPHYIYRKFIMQNILRYRLFLQQNKKCNIMLDIGARESPFKNLFNDICLKYISLDIVHTKINSITASAANLPFKINSIDTIICIEVLDDVYSIDTAFKEIYRILSPGGSIFLTIPFFFKIHDTPYDYYRFTKYYLEKKLIENKFEIIEIKNNGYVCAAIVQNICSVIYEYFENSGRLIKLIVLSFLIIFQRIGLILDKIIRYDKITLGYYCIAKKKT